MPMVPSYLSHPKSVSSPRKGRRSNHAEAPTPHQAILSRKIVIVLPQTDAKKPTSKRRNCHHQSSTITESRGQLTIGPRNRLSTKHHGAQLMGADIRMGLHVYQATNPARNWHPIAPAANWTLSCGLKALSQHKKQTRVSPWSSHSSKTHPR